MVSKALEIKFPSLPKDARDYQIMCLSLSFIIGNLLLGFGTPPWRAAIYVFGAILAQWGFTRWAKLPRFEWKSALISSLSMCLLVRTNDWAIAAFLVFLAIGSKFLIRVQGKHLFNPTHFAICAGLILFDDVWVSPGQWGTYVLFALLFLGAGSFVAYSALRFDVSFSFLGTWLALVFLRSWWVGEPMAIPVHRMQSGAILLFAFFMISDPKTTPETRWGRICFGALVAYGAFFVQFALFRTNGLFWSLLFFTPLVPVLNAWRRESHPQIHPHQNLLST